MKKLNPIFTSAFLLLAATIVFAGCQEDTPCPNPNENTRYMFDSYKEQIPYNGNDTLSFSLNDNDTIICIGTAKKITFEQQQIRDPNPDCDIYYKTNYENYYIDYSLFSIQNSLLKSQCTINCKSTTFEFAVWDIGASGGGLLYDSLNFNDIYYYKVSKFKSKNSDDYIYFNKDYGILQMVISSEDKTYTKL